MRRTRASLFNKRLTEECTWLISGISWDLRTLWSRFLNNFKSLRVSKPQVYLRSTLIKMRSLILKIFRNVARVPKNCKLDIFFSHFFLFFWNYLHRLFKLFKLLAIRIVCVEVLHVFQRVESIHDTKAGFYKRIEFTHSFLMVFVQTAKNAWSKKEKWDILLSETVCTGRSIVITLEATRTA